MECMKRIKCYTPKVVGIVAIMVHSGCITHCALEYIADIGVCSGPSMEPTISCNNRTLIEHITPRFRRIERGDILIAKFPTNPRTHICKRVTGIPGDKMKSGLSYEVVPQGHVWLEGDNQSDSLDSRTFGPVPQGLIEGRVLCTLWPPRELQMLTDRGKWAYVK